MKKYLFRGLMLIFCMLIAVMPANYSQAKTKVKLNKSKASIYVGSSITLKVKGTKKKVKWSTSNKKIVKVTQKGKVTGIKKGNAKVTAKVGKKKYICKVTVKKKNTKETTTDTSTETNTTEQKTETPTNNNSNQTPANSNSQTNSSEENVNSNTDNNNQTEQNDSKDQKVTLVSLSSNYSEAIIEKDGWADATDLARQLRVQRNFSDGTSEIIDEFANPGVYMTDLDTSTVGNYEVTLSCSGEKNSKIPLTIQVSVCDVQENEDFKYISNGNIAKIISYIGESDEVVIPEEIDGATVIGGSLLDNLDVKSISIPKGWRSFYVAPLFMSCENLENIKVEEDNEYFSSIDGVLFDKSQNILWRYPINRDSEEYEIPETVTTIAQGGFFKCKNIKKVIIPKSLKSIYKYLWYAIGTFDDSSLEEFVVDNDNPILKSEDGVLFQDCQVWNADKGSSGEYERVYKLLCYPHSKKDVCYEIPSGVTSAPGMSKNQFLKKLIVPASFTRWSNFYPFVDMEDISVCFDFEELSGEQENGGTSVIAGLFEAGSGTIYVRSDEVKNKVNDMIREKYDDDETPSWVLSDDYNWTKTAD